MTFLNQALRLALSTGTGSVLVLSWALVLGLFLAAPQAWAQAGPTSNSTGNSSLPTASPSAAPSALTTEPSAADNASVSPSSNSANPANQVNPPVLPSQNITIQNAFAPLPADAAVSKTPPAANNKPRWQDLTVSQQKALAPLAERWIDMPLVSKRNEAKPTWRSALKAFCALYRVSTSCNTTPLAKADLSASIS